MKKLLLVLALSCATATVLSGREADSFACLIPRPAQITSAKGVFKVKGAHINYDTSLDARTLRCVSLFADRLYLATQRISSLATATGVQASTPIEKLHGIYLLADASLAPEAYRMEITPKAVKITAAQHNGFFYALQTLSQLLPPSLEDGKTAPGEKWTLPCCTIVDSPRFGWRGLLLDCCRHFFSVQEVKKVLDAMARYKLNRLHWHLTEDQGWRIEIKRFPLLTEVGAYRAGTQVGLDRNHDDGIRYGGYYTQEQIREIVAYAWERGITVMPEIDLPGHMVVALASYPQYGCTGGPYEVRKIWGISKEVLCPGKEETFAFLEGVLDEVVELFPSEYIHIGGDECPKDAWKNCPHCQARIAALGLKDDAKASKEARLQNYVTARIQRYLAGKGRKVIGWDEILEGELGEGTAVMYWRESRDYVGRQVKEAAGKGTDIVMTPNLHCYFDYAQHPDMSREPLRGGNRVLTLDTVYSFEPSEGYSEAEARSIIGVQANMWTEMVASESHLEYMLFPRLLAMSEVQWSPKGSRDPERFYGALRSRHLPLLQALGYNYRKLDQ